MRIESLLFGTRYERLARALVRSAERNCPNIPITVHVASDSDHEVNRHRVKTIYQNNSRKTKHHRQIVHRAKDGEVLCMIDCDTMILRDLSDLEQEDFDLAVTVKPPTANYCINSGVVFVRVSDRMRAWYDDWWRMNRAMLVDSSLLNAYKNKYGGINQCSLGYLLERQRDIKVLELPSAEWNATGDAWPEFGDHVRIVHILGKLRVACMRNPQYSGDPVIKRLLAVWQQYDREST